MRKISLFLVMLICLATTPTYASNYFNFGVNGLLTIPTATTLAPTDLNMSYQRIGAGHLLLLNYGFKDGIVLGGAINWPQGLDYKGDFAPLLKVKLVEENRTKPVVTVGNMNRSLYLVASKSTPYYGIRAHAGIRDKDKFKDMVFAGATKVLNPVAISSNDSKFEMPITTAILEYNRGVNLGAKFEFIPQIEANLGVLDLFDSNTFSFGVSFKNKF